MSKFLDAFAAEASAKGHHLYRVSEIVGDGDPETVDVNPASDCMNCYSVAKLFTQAAIGILCDAGLLSVEEKICDIFPRYARNAADPRFKDITVDMVLRHHCGFSCGMLDIDRFNIHDEIGADFLEYIFAQPLVADPDTEFTYSDAAYYLLSRVVSEKCGKKLDDMLWDKLFWPLGFREAAWSKCPHGYALGATGLYIRSDDMAKLGVVYLNNGLYRGRRILSEEWVKKAIDRRYDLYPIGIGNAFYKGGMYGQELIMIPEKNRVVAWHANNRFCDPGSVVEWCCNYDG